MFGFVVCQRIALCVDHLHILSARRPALVMRTVATSIALPPTLMRGVAVVSPARTSSTIKPCARINASVQPSCGARREQFERAAAVGLGAAVGGSARCHLHMRGVTPYGVWFICFQLEGGATGRRAVWEGS